VLTRQEFLCQVVAGAVGVFIVAVQSVTYARYRDVREGTVWEGVVESFALSRPSKAGRCYAWSFDDNGKIQCMGVLELPPVESPKQPFALLLPAESSNSD
jgi:hypothetical protein